MFSVLLTNERLMSGCGRCQSYSVWVVWSEAVPKVPEFSSLFHVLTPIASESHLLLYSKLDGNLLSWLVSDPRVDLRTVSFDVPPQEILSRDSVTVAVDAVVYYRISNATVAVSNVEDYGRSTRLLAATTLRNVLGTKDLSQILSERESISHIMQSSLDEATDPWGVKVERVEM